MRRGAITIRPMEPGDLPVVERIQYASPEASQWKPEEYLSYEGLVAEQEGHIAGFAVARRLPPDEIEILNVATDPAWRRKGVGSALLRELLNLQGGILFLEVRESNLAARALYKSAGFTDAGRRKNYYAKAGIPTGLREDAVVMKLQK